MSTLKFNKWQSIDGVTRNAVLQVVSGTIDTFHEIAGTSFEDTPITASITPTSATSKILVLFNINCVAIRSTSNTLGAFRLKRDSTTIYAPHTNNGTGNYGTIGISSGGATSSTIYSLVPIQYLDSPGTTNQVTYMVQGCIYQTGSSPYLRINLASTTGSQVSNVTLIEVAQ